VHTNKRHHHHTNVAHTLPKNQTKQKSVITSARGHALLLGVGGSGRKSLARAAAQMAGATLLSVDPTASARGYRPADWREDLRKLVVAAGVDGRQTVFLLDEAHVAFETMLGDVATLMAGGGHAVARGLWAKDELPAVLEPLRAVAHAECRADAPQDLFALMVERALDNLHIVLCMSPTSSTFSARISALPALVSCATVDYFGAWTTQALSEVALHRLAAAATTAATTNSVDEQQDGGRNAAGTLPEAIAQHSPAVAAVLAEGHQAAEAAAAKLWQTARRRVHVTPAHFLEAVDAYAAMASERAAALGAKAAKLRAGIARLDEAGAAVAELRSLAAAKAAVVEKARTDCDALLVAIVADKRAADERERAIQADAARISREAADADVAAAAIEAELEAAMPALRDAEAALNVLTKRDVTELKGYSKPPAAVELALDGVLAALRRPQGWDEAKRALADANFMAKLLAYDRDAIDDALLKRIARITSHPDFSPDAVGKVSAAARGMVMWVRAIEAYGIAARDIVPKRARLASARDTLSRKRTALAAAQEALAAALQRVAELRSKYDASTAERAALEAEHALLSGRLDRAARLVAGLAGEHARWSETVAKLTAALAALPGDAARAALTLAYSGPFSLEVRAVLSSEDWAASVTKHGLPCSPADAFNAAEFLAGGALRLNEWRAAGLPADGFSAESGAIAAYGRRWPYMLDPQGQAVRWVKGMEAAKGLRTVAVGARDMLRQVTAAVQTGSPLLLLGVQAPLEPSIAPLLNKSYRRRGSSTIVNLGNREVEVAPGFALYMATAASDADALSPELSAAFAVVDFGATPTGVEAQLLEMVLAHERPELATKRLALSAEVAAGRRQQAALEDAVLELLGSANGMLLDNGALVDALDESRKTWVGVSTALTVAEAASKELEAAASAYQPAAARGAAIYFVLAGLAALNPLYGIGLDVFRSLFEASLVASSAGGSGNGGGSSSNKTGAGVLSPAERVKLINDHVTYAAYVAGVRSVFVWHAPLVAFAIAVCVASSTGRLPAEELAALLGGGGDHCRSSSDVGFDDAASAPRNPSRQWLSDAAWRNVLGLNALPSLRGLASSFEATNGEWEAWARNAEPETADLPSGWDTRCGDVQRLLLARAIRPDRVPAAAAIFVTNALGRRFVEVPAADLADVGANSASPDVPIVLLLAPGTDPHDALQRCAEGQGGLVTVALGSGQIAAAQRAVEEAKSAGRWVFLTNAHLAPEAFPDLAKLADGLDSGSSSSSKGSTPHPNFRLWISSAPVDGFPASLLQVRGWGCLLVALLRHTSQCVQREPNT
jgi:dynein heavy chain